MVRYGATRGRNVHAALPPSPTWQQLLIYRMKHLSGAMLKGWAIAGLIVLSIWMTWYLATRSVRHELHRVQNYLRAQPGFENLSMSIPWFTTKMPDKIDIVAIGIPTGFATEVHVELTGSYDTHTRNAHFEGEKQVLFPYKKIKLNWDRPVPAE